MQMGSWAGQITDSKSILRLRSSPTLINNMGNGRLTGVRWGGIIDVLVQEERKTRGEPTPTSRFFSLQASPTAFPQPSWPSCPPPLPPRLTVDTSLYSLPTVLTWDNHPPVCSYGGGGSWKEQQR